MGGPERATSHVTSSPPSLDRSLPQGERDTQSRVCGERRKPTYTFVYRLYCKPAPAPAPSPNRLKIQIDLEPPRHPAVNSNLRPALNRQTLPND